MNKNLFLMLLGGKISTEQKLMINDKLDNIDEKKFNNLSLIPFKNPLIAVVLGIAFGIFGVDRFYQGNIKLGVLKLVIWLVGVLTIFLFIGIFILWALYIYVLVDLFFVYKAVQNDNYQKILKAIEG